MRRWECGSRRWRVSAAQHGERSPAPISLYRWWGAGAVSYGCILFPARQPARNTTSGCERPCSAASAHSGEAARTQAEARRGPLSSYSISVSAQKKEIPD
jgi:hypothetical protein